MLDLQDVFVFDLLLSRLFRAIVKLQRSSHALCLKSDRDWRQNHLAPIAIAPIYLT